jgi:hypothetical protein
MSQTATKGFKHTTLTAHPESIISDDKGNITGYTPKQAGYVLLDEEPGVTGIYVKDVNGGLWPARTVTRSAPNYTTCTQSWLSREGAEDRRTIKEPTAIDKIRGRLKAAGVAVVMETDDKLKADTDGFYERYGSDHCSHVGFEVRDWGDQLITVTVKCPIEFGGKVEEYNNERDVDSEDGVKRIIEVFG